MIKAFKNEKFFVFLIYSALIGAVYSQVAFFGKSLLSTLYYPSPLCVTEAEGRKPNNTFNIDLGTPAFYEMPINMAVGNMYKKGILPLWNPYQAAGTPLAAQYSTRVFFPYQILEDISPEVLWDYFMLLRLIIAAFFTYLLLRLIGISLPSAFLGGALYGLSGSLTWFINLEEFVNVAMMVPACLFSIERLMQYKKPRYIAECALVTALMLLAGQPEIAVYVMLLASLYYIFRVTIEKPDAPAFIRSILRFGGIVFLGLALSAFLILPFLELIPISYQCHPLGGMMGAQDPTDIMAAVSVLIPSFFEIATNYRLFAHNGLWDWIGGYTGMLAVFLIILGIFSNGRHRESFIFFSLFGFFIVLKNFGFPLAAWIGRLPLLDQSWSPRWSGPVWTFSLACAAAIGLDMARAAEFKKSLLLGSAFFLMLFTGFLLYKAPYIRQLPGCNAAQFKSILPPIFGGIFVGVCTVLAAVDLFIYYRGKRGFIHALIWLAICELWVSVPKGSVFPWTAYELIPFTLGIVVVYLLAKDKRRLGAAGIAAIALLSAFIDLRSPYGLPDRKDIFEKPGCVRFIKKDTDHFRIIAGSGVFMPNFASAFEVYDVRYINSLSLAAFQNYVDNHLMKEPHAWITDRLWFTGIGDFHKAEPRSLYQEINDNLPYYSYLGVKYIIVPPNLKLEIPLVYDKDVKIYRNPQAFPRAYVSGGIKMASGFSEAQEMMSARDMDLLNTAIIEEGPPSWYRPSAAGIESKTKIEEYAPGRIKIKADLGSDGILVITDNYYPGWRVYVDGEEDRIYRVNGLVRGVFLEKGVHDVIFKYQPMSFRIGALISLAGLAVCGVLMFNKRNQE